MLDKKPFLPEPGLIRYFINYMDQEI